MPAALAPEAKQALRDMIKIDAYFIDYMWALMQQSKFMLTFVDRASKTTMFMHDVFSDLITIKQDRSDCNMWMGLACNIDSFGEIKECKNYAGQIYLNKSQHWGTVYHSDKYSDVKMKPLTSFLSDGDLKNTKTGAGNNAEIVVVPLSPCFCADSYYNDIKAYYPETWKNRRVFCIHARRYRNKHTSWMNVLYCPDMKQVSIRSWGGSDKSIPVRNLTPRFWNGSTEMYPALTADGMQALTYLYSKYEKDNKARQSGFDWGAVAFVVGCCVLTGLTGGTGAAVLAGISGAAKIASQNGVPIAPFNAVAEGFNVLSGEEQFDLSCYISAGVQAYSAG